jgi:hypothetical protein
VANQRHPLPDLLDGLLDALPGFNILASLSQQDPALSACVT